MVAAFHSLAPVFSFGLILGHSLGVTGISGGCTTIDDDDDLEVAGRSDVEMLQLDLKMTSRRIRSTLPLDTNCWNQTVDAANMSLPGRKPVVWVHIKKSAGTTVCCEASRREKVLSPEINCNAVDHTGIFGWPRESTCEQREALMASGNFTWTAVERVLYDNDFCRSFVYGTILRQPLGTMESWVDSKGLSGLRTLVQPQPTCRLQPDIMQDSLIVFDNFIIRYLGGYSMEEVPLGGINSSHLAHAQTILDRFDVVLLFERMTDQRAIARMDSIVGWHVPWQTSHGNASPDEVTLAAVLTDEQLECLKTVNRFDSALYEYVREQYYS